MQVDKTVTENKGLYRHIKIHHYRTTPPASAAIVIVAAFIENAYWFQIDKKGFNLAQQLANLGFDVHVVEFPINKKQMAKIAPADASFKELVGKHLPEFHDNIAPKYHNIHYMSHSYGVTLVMAFLLGYTPQKGGYFAPDEQLALKHQKNVASFISLAGLFKLAWPKDFWLKEGLRGIPYPMFEFVLSKVPLTSLRKVSTIIPSSVLRLSNYIPVKKPFPLLFKALETFGLTPSFHFPNANLEAIRMALSKGSNDESWETVLTILSLSEKKNTKGLKSKALTHFSKHLSLFDLPICFIQGSKDQVTHPKVIREYGYNKVGSKDKHLVNLANTGHQDILAAKSPQTLIKHLKQWILRENFQRRV